MHTQFLRVIIESNTFILVKTNTNGLMDSIIYTLTMIVNKWKNCKIMKVKDMN